MLDSTTHWSMMLNSYGSTSLWFVMLSPFTVASASRIDLNNNGAIAGALILSQA